MTMEKLTKAFSADMSFVDGERAIVVTLSTPIADRDGESLLPMGMNSKNFEQNPVFCYFHDYKKLPVGKVAALTRDSNKIVGKVIFADRPETHPPGLEWIPDTLFSLYQQGIMKAVSVGLEPYEVRPPTPLDKKQFGDGCRTVVSKWHLTELSACTIGVNPEALAIAVSKGICSEATAKAILPATITEKGIADLEAVATALATTDAADAQLAADIEKAAEIIEKALPQPIPVKHVFFLGPPPIPEPDYAAITATETKAAVAKAQGRVYLIL